MFWLHVCQKRDKILITLQIPSYRYLWLLEQCGLSGKTVVKKFSGCGLYAGALNKPKFPVTSVLDGQSDSSVNESTWSNR